MAEHAIGRAWGQQIMGSESLIAIMGSAIMGSESLIGDQDRSSDRVVCPKSAEARVPQP